MNSVQKLPPELRLYLTDRKKQVNKTLVQILEKPSASQYFSDLDDALKHTVLLHGKRLRPILAIAVYEMYKQDISNVLAPACAIELIHAGSLMLDDLPCMDNAHFRRGKKTNHILYGESVTILASAALWVQAFEILSDIKDVRINQLVRETSESIGKNGLILGQYMDLFAFDKKQSIEDLIKCYTLKTSSLFLLAVRYGTTLGGAKESERLSLESFGNSLGIAFQIQDDIADATLSKSQTGKDTQQDEANHKPNYVSLLGLEQAKEALKKEADSALHALNSINKDTKILKMLLQYVIS